MKEFYCDGSTRGKNQKGADNIGGWGMVCFNIYSPVDMELETFECDTNYNTTNNREELKAFLCCLSTIKELYSGEKCIIYSDSAYVVNMWNSWISGWARNGWKNSKKQTVENLDLVQQIYKFYDEDFFLYDVRKCDGHEGVEGNELADALATGNYNRFIDLCELYQLDLPREDIEWLERKMDISNELQSLKMIDI